MVLSIEKLDRLTTTATNNNEMFYNGTHALLCANSSDDMCSFTEANIRFNTTIY